MEFMVIFFLAAFAMGGAQECTEERAEVCIESLLTSLLGDTTEAEVCRELDASIACLREAVNECMVDETDEEVEEGLAELEKVLKENCSEGDSKDDDDEDEEMKQCFSANEEYIYECIYEGSTQALAAMIENEDIKEEELQCNMYRLMANCFVERVGEKCGAEAEKVAKEEMDDLPDEIKAACETAAQSEEPFFQLLDKKKK